jgi:hypothetical protein
MPAYRWCGLTLGSSFALPELSQAPSPGGGGHDWTILIERSRAQRGSANTARWFHHWEFPDGRSWLSFARRPRGYLLRFPSLADFQIDADRHVIRCVPVGGRHEVGPYTDTVRHLLLDQVLPLVIGGDDCLVLHASVVAIDGGAVAFLAPAGHGKSTIAAELARRGFALVSDDCCFLRRRPRRRGAGGAFDVVPSYPGVRLWPKTISHVLGATGALARVSHYSTKRRVSSGDSTLIFSDGPVPLRRLYLIAPLADLKRARRLTVSARTPRDAALDILNFTFHLDVEHAPRVRETFELAADLAGSYGVRRLTFPWNLRKLRAVADAIIDCEERRRSPSR